MACILDYVHTKMATFKVITKVHFVILQKIVIAIYTKNETRIFKLETTLNKAFWVWKRWHSVNRGIKHGEQNAFSNFAGLVCTFLHREREGERGKVIV